MKTWFGEFLQNAAFPAVVLAFACSPINTLTMRSRMSGQAASPITARAAQTRTCYIAPMNREAWYQPTKTPAFNRIGEPNLTFP
jgi:hypothetical protein